MRYRLRTLLIVMAVGPVVLWFGYHQPAMFLLGIAAAIFVMFTWNRPLP